MSTGPTSGPLEPDSQTDLCALKGAMRGLVLMCAVFFAGCGAKQMCVADRAYPSNLDAVASLRLTITP